MTPKLLLLLLPLLTGSMFCYRVMKLRQPFYFLPVGFCLGWVVTLMASNLWLRAGFSLDTAFYLTFATVGAPGLLALYRRPPLDPEPPKLDWFGWLYLIFGLAVVWFTTTSKLYLNVDGDFWIHSPMQAQMLLGNFPPKNPFFPDIPYGGHYARDLLAVLVSWSSGADLYACNIPVTGLLQWGAFLLLFLTGYRHGGGQSAAILMSLFVFAGGNAGERVGWLDTVANNTALANLHTALLFFLLMRALFEKVQPAEIAITGALYAGLAWSYETNFVSLTLGLLMLAALTAAKRQLTLVQLKTTAVLVAVALVFIVLQGGALANLIVSQVTPKSGGPKAEFDERLQAQHQEVKLRFPKEKLFQINLSRAGEDLSLAYLTVPFAKKLEFQVSEPGYVSIFSPRVWRVHWIAFYLFPLSFLALWRRFDVLGLMLWSYGFVSFMLPAVVDFGVFEVEVYRWQFSGGYGFAGALGCALALWYDRTPGPLFEWGQGWVSGGRKAGILTIIGLLCYYNTYPARVQMKDRTFLLPSWKDGWRIPTARAWLATHPILGTTELDIELGRRLFALASPGDRFLTNFRERNHHNMLVECAFIGLSGVQPIGHSLPLEYERVGTPPFRRDALARAYWASGDAELLRNRPPRWLYYSDDTPGQKPRPTESVRLVEERAGRYGSRALYQVTLQPFQRGHSAVKPASVTINSLELSEPPLPEQYSKAKITVSNPGVQSIEGEYLLTYRFPDQPNEEGLTQTIAINLKGGQTKVLEVHFVTPHHQGEFEVEFLLSDGKEERPAGRSKLVVGGSEVFAGLKADWQNDRPLEAGVLTEVPIRFTNTSAHPLDFAGVASLRAQVPEVPPVQDDFQSLEFILRAGESRTIRLAFVPPAQAGQWPVNLLLSPGYAVNTYDLGIQTTIESQGKGHHAGSAKR